MDAKKAKTIADEYTDRADVILVTSDGSVFFGPQRHACEYHAKERKLDIFEFVSGKAVEYQEQKPASIPLVVIPNEPIKNEANIVESIEEKAPEEKTPVASKKSNKKKK